MAESWGFNLAVTLRKCLLTPQVVGNPEPLTLKHQVDDNQDKVYTHKALDKAADGLVAAPDQDDAPGPTDLLCPPMSRYTFIPTYHANLELEWSHRC